MKEYGINTLIELLNEYEIWKTKDKVSQNPKRSRREWSIGMLGGIFGTLMNERESRLSIISKSYGFIQWLVQEDKVDTRKIDEDRLETIQYSEKERITICDWLIMILAISKNPISLLTSYLK